MIIRMKTKMTELLGIQYPIMCGPMLHIAKPELCAAVSNAGGLGNLTAACYNNGEELRTAIHETRKLTDKPFSVNVTLLPSMRLTQEILDDFFKVCAEEQVACMDVSGSLATAYMDQMHKAGTKMIHKMGSPRHAKSAERAGYDMVIAAGFEEGGYPLRDDVATTVLTPSIVEAVNIPVITTGGMVSGKSFAAALSLGASGIMMASRFIATKDCPVHENIKKLILDHDAKDTIIICKKIMQGRALFNENVRRIQAIEEEGVNLERIYDMLSGSHSKLAYENGDTENFTFMVGQSIGLIHDLPTVEELITRIVAEAIDVTKKNLACFS